MENYIKRKKLLYQSIHRGCKEIDILLGDFAKKFISSLSDKELFQYEKILNEEDNYLYKILLKKETIPSHIDKKLINMIINFNESKVKTTIKHS